MKYFLFGTIVTLVLSITAYLIWSTIATNVNSVTGGPVHYHADFEIWNCGQEVETKDPGGFSNKVGSSTVHEHNDKRVHIEGAIQERKQASLGYFIAEIGGVLTDKSLAVSTNQGMLRLKSGELCNNNQGLLQVFVYQTKNNMVTQRKLKDPASYVISPHSQVPPGDCVIIEFDRLKDKTDKICSFYEIAIQKGDLVEK